jgi:FkbM family methyltransferase
MKKLLKKVISSQRFCSIKLRAIHFIINSGFTPIFIKKIVIKIRKYLPKVTISINFSYDKHTHGKLLLDLRSYCDREIFFNQFEPATYRFYAALLDRYQYKCVWDIGSYIGFYTILAGIKLKQQGKVYAFEPMLKTFARLKENIKLNDLKNVKLFNVALAQKNGFQEIYTLNVQHVTSSPTLSREWAQNNNFITKGKIATKNAFQQLHSGKLEKPDIIKIDAETLEPEILGTIKDLLKGRDAPDTICELMPPTLENLNKLLLEECGYKLYHINLNGAQEVEELKMRRPFNDYYLTKRGRRSHPIGVVHDI